MNGVTPTAPAPYEVPVVTSFAVAAQLRMTGTDTRATLAVALPQDPKVPTAGFVPALLTLGQRVLEDHRLTGQELPEVEVTTVERVTTVPPRARATGFTVGVVNDLDARSSSVVLDSDYLLGNDGGVLLIAATLFAAAEHLLEAADPPAPGRAPDRRRPGNHPRRRPRNRR